MTLSKSSTTSFWNKLVPSISSNRSMLSWVFLVVHSSSATPAKVPPTTKSALSSAWKPRARLSFLSHFSLTRLRRTANMNKGGGTVATHIHTCTLRKMRHDAEEELQADFKPQACGWSMCPDETIWKSRVKFCHHVMRHLDNLRFAFSLPRKSAYPGCQWKTDGKVCGETDGSTTAPVSVENAQNFTDTCRAKFLSPLTGAPSAFITRICPWSSV